MSRPVFSVPSGNPGRTAAPGPSGHPAHAGRGRCVYTDSAEAVPALADLLLADSVRRILICGHVRPDGDCIGSMMAMHDFLQGRGKEVRLYCRGPVPENLWCLLPGGRPPEEVFPGDYHPEVTLCLDAGSEDRIHPAFLENARGLVVNIDHHLSNCGYGQVNWLDEAASATGEMLFRLLEAVSGAWTPCRAELLYIAIVSDTGGFRYTNTRTGTLRAAARLVEEGARPSDAAAVVWGNRKPEIVRLAATVLSALRFELDGRLVWSEIPQSLFRENGGEANDPENLGSEMRTIQGVEVALLIREYSDGATRASLRAGTRVDVSRIAQRLGGGGHQAAAGLELRGDHAAARERILEAVRAGVREQLDGSGAAAG